MTRSAQDDPEVKELLETLVKLGYPIPLPDKWGGEAGAKDSQNSSLGSDSRNMSGLRAQTGIKQQQADQRTTFLGGKPRRNAHGANTMKPDNEKQTTHLACHVNDLTLGAWDEVRKAESPDPDNPVKWSQWVRGKVDVALAADVLQSNAVDTSSIEAQELRRENEDLKKRMAALETREIGVSLNRVIEILQGGEYVDFDTIVQELIRTEATATYETLQELAGKYIVECNSTATKWRLRA